MPKKNISAGVFIRAIIYECNPCFIWIWKPWIVQDKVNRNLRIYFLSLLLLTKTWHLYYFKVVYCFITILFKFFLIFCSGLVSSHCTFNLKDKEKNDRTVPLKVKLPALLAEKFAFAADVEIWRSYSSKNSFFNNKTYLKNSICKK